METSFEVESTLPLEQAEDGLMDQSVSNDINKADTTMESSEPISKELAHGISFNEIPGTPIVNNSKGL